MSNSINIELSRLLKIRSVERAIPMASLLQRRMFGWDKYDGNLSSQNFTGEGIQQQTRIYKADRGGHDV